MSECRAAVQPGDVFCVDGNMPVVSALIRRAERFWSDDDAASYGHAGIITTSRGDTLEALWTVQAGELARYAGQRIIIARPEVALCVTPSGNKKLQALVTVSRHLGRWYPVWRLALHLLPPLAKYCATGDNLVCSELVAKYLSLLGSRPEPYTGVNPDTLADEWTRWRNFSVVYEGVW